MDSLEKRSSVHLLDVTINPEKFDEEMRPVFEVIRPQWKAYKIRSKPIGEGGGLANMLRVCCITDDLDDAIVVRIYGTSFSAYMDRKQVIKNYKLLNDTSISPELYCMFNNGMCLEYVKGKVCRLDDRIGFDDEIAASVIALELAKFHCKQTSKIAKEKYGIPMEASTPRIVKQALSDWDEDFVRAHHILSSPEFPSKETLHREISQARDMVDELRMEPVFSHNDPHPANCIFNPEKGVGVLVDYDLSGFNWPTYDIAYFLIFALSGIPSNRNLKNPLIMSSPEFQRKFIHTYLEALAALDAWGREVTESDVERHLVFVEKTMLFVMLFFIIVSVIILQKTPDDPHFEGFTLRLWRLYLDQKDKMLSQSHDRHAEEKCSQ